MDYKQKLIIKTAKLYYLEGLNLNDISKKLQISPATISRYLKKALESNIVEIKINDIKDENYELEKLLELKYSIRECYIVTYFKNEIKMYKEAAGYLINIFERLLKDDDYLGVSWGRTDKGIIDCMDRVKIKNNIKLVPIIGSMGDVELGINTNSISRKLADKIDGTSYVINSPAFLDTKKIHDAIIKNGNVQRIIELWKKINTAVMGVGNLSTNSTIYKLKIQSKEELDYLKSLGVIGEINLNYINIKGNLVPNEINERLIRMPLEMLKKVKNLILINLTESKSNVLKTVLSQGMVDVLLIDEKTARCL